MYVQKLIRFADLKRNGIVQNWPTLKAWIDREASRRAEGLEQIHERGRKLKSAIG